MCHLSFSILPIFPFFRHSVRVRRALRHQPSLRDRRPAEWRAEHRYCAGETLLAWTFSLFSSLLSATVIEPKLEHVNNHLTINLIL